MQITLIPQRRDDVLTLEKRGDTLVVSGDPLDFSGLPDGSILPSSAIDNPFVFGDVVRINGEVRISILLPRSSPNGVFDEAGNVLAPLVITNPGDGLLSLPIEPEMEAANAD